jgi:hypothetical protein
MIRSKVKQTYHIYAHVITVLQSSYLGQLSTQHQLISGQLDVFLLSCFLVRLVPVPSFPTDLLCLLLCIHLSSKLRTKYLSVNIILSASLPW